MNIVFLFLRLGGTRMLFEMLIIVVLLIIGVLVYMVLQAFENHLLHHEIRLRGKKEHVKLFFISDVHLRKINKKMISAINEPIDAVIIGGDFADQRTPIKRIYENIDLLTSLGPVYFVWGNNDREIGEERLRTIFQETNVQIVENNAVILPNVQNKCWISAIDDTTTRNAQQDLAFQKCQQGDIVFFISHNPEVFPMVRKKYTAHLMMGGHLHGGQIRLGPFGLHPHGSFSKREGVPTLISNGYGTTMIPMRFNAKPQCHIIDVNFVP